MSITPVEKTQTPASLRLRKGGVPIACLTAYATPQARLLDPHADLLLVGICWAWLSMVSAARFR